MGFYSGQCAKKDFFNTLINILTNDGNFSMVSSNTTNDKNSAATSADGYVFKSKQTFNNRYVVFSLKESGFSDTAATRYIFLKIGADYTPALTANTNGTWSIPMNNGAFMNMTLVGNNTSLSLDSVIQYWINVYPHCVVIVTQRQDMAYKAPVVNYIGYPEPNTAVENISSHLCLWANNAISVDGVYATGKANQCVNIVKHHNGTAYTYLSTYWLEPPVSPNISGQFFLSPFYIGDSSVGYVGMLTGVYFIKNQNILNEDTITVGNSTYKVFNLNVGYNSFYSGNPSTIALSLS